MSCLPFSVGDIIAARYNPRMKVSDSLSFRISVDTGGTFTDVVIANDKKILSIGKALTTPERIFDGMSAALEIAAHEIGLPAAEILARSSMLTYGTTRATNAVVTGTTAKTAFLTTAGFRDILLFKEGGKNDQHDFSYDFPLPYIPRRRTFEIEERIDAEGGIVTKMNEKQLLATIRALKKQKFEAIAVCLLWSIVNPAHEKRIGEIIEKELPGVPYTLSHELIPIVREYRRASTTAIDASLKPLMQEHLREMAYDLKNAGFKGEILVSTLGGGVQHVADVAPRPVRMLKSGPAMGPVAGKAYVNIEGLKKDAIVCDTGGTTFDVALVRDGDLVYTRDSWLGPERLGHIVALSSVDVRSIGAGGGSIAWIDAGGMLNVGPRSAGAMPGPACYGRGGKEPTVTDACLVLGYIDPMYFNGGRIRLDEAAARSAITHLAKKLHMSPEETTQSILTVANSHMIKAIHEMTVNEGIHPKESVVVAGGGAAGFNIAEIARDLGCTTVIVPKTASVMSACGMHFSDITFEDTRSLVTVTSNFKSKAATETLKKIDLALEAFRKHIPGNKNATYKKEFFVEARYHGQVWDLDISLPVSRFTSQKDIDALVEKFHAIHQRMYAIHDPRSAVECINWRGRLTVHLPKPIQSARKTIKPARTVAFATRTAFFAGAAHKTKIYRGDTLTAGAQIAGPAIIEEPTTTIVIPPYAQAHVSASGNYILTI